MRKVSYSLELEHISREQKRDVADGGMSKLSGFIPDPDALKLRILSD
jgi:hypothetical protein